MKQHGIVAVQHRKYRADDDQGTVSRWLRIVWAATLRLISGTGLGG